MHRCKSIINGCINLNKDNYNNHKLYTFNVSHFIDGLFKDYEILI